MLQVNQLIGFGAGNAAASAGVATGTFVDQGTPDTLQATNSASVYTFTSALLGTVSHTHRLVLACGGAGANATTISGVTVGGSACVLAGAALGAPAKAQNGNTTLELWEINYTTDGTGQADIVVTFNASKNDCGVGVFQINDSSGIAVDSDNDTTNTLTGVLSCLAGGVMIGASYNKSTSTVTWANVTEKYNEAVDTGHPHSGGIADFASAQTDLNVTNVLGTANTEAGVFAAWDAA